MCKNTEQPVFKNDKIILFCIHQSSDCWTLKMNTLQSFETSRIAYAVTQHNIPGNFSLLNCNTEQTNSMVFLELFTNNLGGQKIPHFYRFYGSQLITKPAITPCPSTVHCIS